MSADSWAICPQCSEAAIQAQRERQEKAKAAYGKVPAEEYLTLLELVSPSPILEENLREDYEIGTNVYGMFYVSYQCSCSKCGFSYQFSHIEQVI